MKELYIIEDSILKGLTEAGKHQGILVLPEGITDIIDGIFNGVAVKEITFPSSLKNIPDWILMGHTELEKVTISKGTERIMEYAFSGCHWLKNVTIPDSVTAIESYAFEECESLECLHLPESVKVIEDGAFCGCSSLEEIDIPDGIEEIQDDTFSDCGSLKTIRLPDSLRAIYGGPFWNCTNLRSITIPKNVSRIYNNAFLGCSALTDIFIESDELELGDGLYIPNGCRVHRPKKKMTDEEAKKAYFEVCKHEFPIIVEIIEEYCSAGIEGESQYRTKEEVLNFALMLIENFGPYPSDGGLVSDAWDYAFEHWNEVCPPHPELDACGTDSMSEEALSEWFSQNAENIA